MANIPTNAMKRSASNPQGASGLNITLPDIPYTHYALIYINNEGMLMTEESQSIQEKGITVFSEGFRQNFIGNFGEPIRHHQPIRQTRPIRLKQRKGIDGEARSKPVEMATLKVGDTERITDYYEQTINHFLQSNCCVIIRAVIRLIEPQKHLNYPYSGGVTGDPDKTRPNWWPSSIKHKDPEHIGKEDRIKLFIYILRQLGSHGITADRLEQVASGCTLKEQQDIHILYELCRVRKIEERFERGEFDANMLVTKGNEEKDSSKAILDLMGAPKHKEQGPPIVPVEQGFALTRKSEDLTSGSIYDLPGSLSIPSPLNFDVLNRQYYPSYKISPEYINPFPQPGLSTPKINDTPISIQNNSLGHISDYQPTEAPSYYGPSMDSSTYQPVAPPQDYGPTATSQSTTIHTQVLTGSTTFHNINYYNAISHGSQPYYLGSISDHNRLPFCYGGGVSPPKP